MSRSTSTSPSSHRRGAHGGGGSNRDGGDEGGGGGGGGGPLVKVAFARNQAEAEMIQGLLGEAGIPSILHRSGGFDTPEFLAAGPRDVKVVSDLAEKARVVLAETLVAEGEDQERVELEEEGGLRRGGTETSAGRLALWVGAAFLGALILVWILYQLS